MASGPGHFDPRGNACLKLHLCGVAHKEPGLEFEGIIDTGFTGFIQLPIQHAFSLKLPLEGTAGYTLADGSSSVCLTALARTTWKDKTETGTITLTTGATDILIGMEFLRRFKLGLLIVMQTVMLIDETELQQFAEDATAKQDSTDAASGTVDASGVPKIDIAKVEPI